MDKHMSYSSLQAVIGNAVVDSEFRKGLLNGSRLRIISNFNLTAEETNVVMGIHADTLEHFAGQLDHWMTIQAEGNAKAPSLPPALKYRPRARFTHDYDWRRD
jgi:hypothetical protein